MYNNNSTLNINKANFINFRNENIVDFYEFAPKELGRGAYGVVYKGREKNPQGPWRAVKKIVKRTIKNPNSLKNQIQNLIKLDHPTILKIYQIFQDASNIYLITDFCQGGQMFDKLQKLGSFSQKQARIIFAQILQAIKYCHKQKVAHRDLKPQNLLFLNNENLNLKLIDFGLSFHFENNMRAQLIEKGDTKLVGTSYYIPPEIIQGSYDQRCDIWSLGVILYIMVTAVPPFDGNNDKQIIASVKRGEYTFDIPQMKKVSAQCKDLIKRIFVHENNRISIQQIFKHPWMKAQVPTIPLQLSYKRLFQFGNYSKLKKITANFIASKFSQKQVERLSIVFKQMDTNNDGSISIQQLKYALDSQKQSKSYQELRQLMDAIDTDKNGKINYTEFIASSIQAAKLFTKQNLIRVFKMIDKDGNQNVDKSQLRQILQKNNLSIINGKQLDQIMQLYDKNHDGKIDLQEFMAAMEI